MVLVGGAVESVDALLAVDVGAMPADDLFEALRAVAAVQSRLELFVARGLEELDRSGAADAHFGHKASVWLAHEASLPRGATRRTAKAGHALRSRFDGIEAAVVDGRLHMHHAKFLTDACNPRVVDQLAELQGELIAFAEGASFELWCASVRVLVEELDQDGSYDPDQDIERNKLHLSRLMNGLTKVSAELVGADALIFEAALQSKADELFQRFSNDRDVSGGAIDIPSPSTLMALAMMELVREGLAVDLNATAGPQTELTLIASADEPTKVCDHRGHKLPNGTTVTVCCDPVIWSVIVNAFGVPLDLGRKARFVSDAQRRAMALRDGGCAFPGCTAPPSWTDAHHILEWVADKGPTDLVNLVSVCRHHHGVTHRKGWAVNATADGWFYWTTAEGRAFWSQRHGRQRTDTPPPIRVTSAA